MDSSAGKCGYDDRIFISDVPDYLHCVVCTLILRDPVMILQCGHKFCRSCFKQMEDHSLTTLELRCPIDRGEIDVTSVQDDVAMKRAIGNLLVRCEYEGGCGWTGELSELAYHIEKYHHEQTTSEETDIPSQLSMRLYHCESSLLGKEKEIASLKLLIQEQQRQHKLQLKNLQIRDQEREQQLQQLQLELQQQQQKQLLIQEQQDQQQKQIEDNKKVITDSKDVLKYKLKETRKNVAQQLEFLRNQVGTLRCGSSLAKFQPVLETESDSETEADLDPDYLDCFYHVHKYNKKAWQLLDIPGRKKLGLHHHSGDPSKVTINNKEHTVKFEAFATVSCPDAIVKQGKKAYYEIVYTNRSSGCTYQHIGWATSSLPTSQEYTETGVGYGPDSYGFKPFNMYKIHNAPKKVLDHKTWKCWGDRIEGFTGTVGVALDMVKGEILYAVGGKWTSCRTPCIAFKDVDTTKEYFPAISGAGDSFRFNFGEREFCFGPPEPSFKKLIDIV